MNPYLAALVVLVNAAIFTHFDAAKLRDFRHVGAGPKGIPPHSWAALVFLFLPLALPYYLLARSTASAAPLREGPPPQFTARDLNVWGYVGSVAFLAGAVYLGLIGQFSWAALSGLAMVVSLFGGRKAVQAESEQREFDLGGAAWDMSSFRPVDDDDSDDEEYVAGAAGSFIPPVAGRGGSVQPGVRAGAADPGAESSAGLDIFSPPTRSDSATPVPASAPTSAPSPRASGPVFADASPPLAMAASDDEDDEDVWDPLRADEEAQRAKEQGSTPVPVAPVPAAPEPAASVPPPPPPAPEPLSQAAPQSSSPSSSLSMSLGEELPPGLVDDEEPSLLLDDDLAPFELAPDEDDEPVLAVPQDGDPDDDLEVLAPLPPLATGGSRPAPRPMGSPGARSPEAPGRQPPGTQPPGTQSPRTQPSGTQPFRTQPPERPTPEPRRREAPRPKPSDPSSPRPPRGAAPPPGGFVGQASSSGPPAVVIWFAIIGAILGLAWWIGSRNDEAPPQVVETVAPVDEAVDEAPAVEDTGPAVERAEAAEEAMRRRMNGWISTYDTVMRPLADLVEEIDFGELGQGACLELQRQAEKANRQLKAAPDEEVELLLRPAFESFLEAGRACSASDEMQWSIHLLQGKDHTHETQILLDERYRYVGPFELEQEEALGHQRSRATISGRYLAGELAAQQTDP